MSKSVDALKAALQENHRPIASTWLLRQRLTGGFTAGSRLLAAARPRRCMP